MDGGKFAPVAVASTLGHHIGTQGEAELCQIQFTPLNNINLLKLASTSVLVEKLISTKQTFCNKFLLIVKSSSMEPS